jgi:aryl-alcohol dehydrogenase-like predicted oxidoreductase
MAGVEQSLTRLKTDYLDGLQFHASPSRQTLEEHDALEAVLALKRAGTARFIGMSFTLPHLPDHIAMGVFDVFQIPYSAVEREHEAVITAAAAAGAGIVIRGGAAKGAPSEGKQAGAQWERWQKARLDDLLEGMTPMEFILRFTFTHPDMHTNIVGTMNQAHLQGNINALLKGRFRQTCTPRRSAAWTPWAQRHKGSSPSRLTRALPPFGPRPRSSRPTRLPARRRARGR